MTAMCWDDPIDVVTNKSEHGTHRQELFTHDYWQCRSGDRSVLSHNCRSSSSLFNKSLNGNKTWEIHETGSGSPRDR